MVSHNPNLVSLVEASHLIGKNPATIYRVAMKSGWQMQPSKVEKGLAWKIRLYDLWLYGVNCQKALVPDHLRQLVDQWTLWPMCEGIVNVVKFVPFPSAEARTLANWLSELCTNLECQVIASSQLEFESETTQYQYVATLKLKIA